MDFQNHLFVGVDTHAAVINFFHQVVDTLEIPNNPAHFSNFIEKLKAYSQQPGNDKSKA